MTPDSYDSTFTKALTASLVVATLAYPLKSHPLQNKSFTATPACYVASADFADTSSYGELDWSLSESSQATSLRQFAEHLASNTKDAPAEVTALVTDHFWQLL